MRHIPALLRSFANVDNALVLLVVVTPQDGVLSASTAAEATELYQYLIKNTGTQFQGIELALPSTATLHGELGGQRMVIGQVEGDPLSILNGNRRFQALKEFSPTERFIGAINVTMNDIDPVPGNDILRVFGGSTLPAAAPVQFLAYTTEKFGPSALVTTLTAAQLIGETPAAKLHSLRANPAEHVNQLEYEFNQRGIVNNDVTVLIPNDTIITDAVDEQGAPCYRVTLPVGEVLSIVDGNARVAAMLRVNPDSEFRVVWYFNGQTTPGFIALNEQTGDILTINAPTE